MLPDVAFLARIESMVKRNSPSWVPKKLLLISLGIGTDLRIRSTPSHHDAESFDVAEIRAMFTILFLASISGLEVVPCKEPWDRLAPQLILRDGKVYFPRCGSLLLTVLGIWAR